LPPRLRLTAIITDTPAKATDWKTRYNIADRNIYSYDTMHRIADNPDIDVVYIVTPRQRAGRGDRDSGIS
jgi:predicted dehydrogenase